MSEMQPRAETGPEKRSDLPICGGVAFLAVVLVLVLNPTARATTSWVLTAWVMAVVWVVLTHALIQAAQQVRVWRAGRGGQR